MYKYIEEPFGKFWGFLTGWAYGIVYMPANVAAIAIAFGTQFAGLFHLADSWIGQYGYYFFVAFLSHVLLDTLNHKSVRLFYPLKIGVKFNICKANGFVNNVLFIIATVYAGNMFYQYIMKFLSL